MRPLIGLLALALVVVATVSGGGVSAHRATAATVSYDAPSTMGLHEPLLVTFIIENASPETVQVDLGFNRRARFAITIKGPDGLIPDQIVTEHGGGRLGLVTVPPNDRYVQQLLLNDWFPFDKVGPYEIEIRLRSTLTNASGASQEIPVGRIDLSISPRNEATLRATCERLAQAVAGAPEAQQRIDAANALSRVADPVVVPYLRALLKRPGPDDMRLMRGLTRLGTPEARAVLNEATQSGDEEQAALARDALRRMPPN